MSSYATIADLKSYAPSLASLSDQALQGLLDEAERDLDRLVLPPTLLTASLQLLKLGSGTITGGHFTLAITWLGQVYTSPAIPWDADVDDVIAALREATNPLGFVLPTASWQRPQTTSNQVRYPEGPLPGTPIALQAAANLAEQPLPLLAVDNSALVGGTLAVTQVVAGGMKLDPTQLAPRQVSALTRGTCAQAEYRNLMGASFFVKAQYKSTTGPVFNTQGKLPLIGPKVQRELSQSGLLMVGARASKGHSRRPASGSGLGWPSYSRGGW